MHYFAELLYNSALIVKADIPGPLRYLLITHCLLLHAIEAGDLLDSVKTRNISIPAHASLTLKVNRNASDPALRTDLFL